MPSTISQGSAANTSSLFTSRLSNNGATLKPCMSNCIQLYAKVIFECCGGAYENSRFCRNLPDAKKILCTLSNCATNRKIVGLLHAPGATFANAPHSIRHRYTQRVSSTFCRYNKFLCLNGLFIKFMELCFSPHSGHTLSFNPCPPHVKQCFFILCTLLLFWLHPGHQNSL